QQDLARHGERGVVGEFDDIGTRPAAATREVGGGYRGSAAVGGEVELGVETGADLPESPVAVAVEQVHTRVDLVVKGVIVQVHPVRTARRQALDREVFGGERRWGSRSARREQRRRQTHAGQAA